MLRDQTIAQRAFRRHDGILLSLLYVGSLLLTITAPAGSSLSARLIPISTRMASDSRMITTTSEFYSLSIARWPHPACPAPASANRTPHVPRRARRQCCVCLNQREDQRWMRIRNGSSNAPLFPSLKPVNQIIADIGNVFRRSGRLPAESLSDQHSRLVLIKMDNQRVAQRSSTSCTFVR